MKYSFYQTNCQCRCLPLSNDNCHVFVFTHRFLMKLEKMPRQKKSRSQHDASVLIYDCSVAVWALVVSSSKFYFDRNTRDVADGTSDHQWQCLAHLGAGLGVSLRVFHIQGLHDRAAHFVGLSGVRCAIGGRGLNMHPPARDPRESSSLERAACGPFGLREFMLRLHLLHSVSRGWTPAKASVPPTHGGRYVALPQALRRRVRHFR